MVEFDFGRWFAVATLEKDNYYGYYGSRVYGRQAPEA